MLREIGFLILQIPDWSDFVTFVETSYLKTGVCKFESSQSSGRPDGSGRWNNRMAAQHLPQNLARPSSG